MARKCLGNTTIKALSRLIDLDKVIPILKNEIISECSLNLFRYEPLQEGGVH